MITGFKIAHWVGLLMLIIGIGMYSLTDVIQQSHGILLVSSLIGLGLMLMSPFPIVLFIQWAKAQDKKE